MHGDARHRGRQRLGPHLRRGGASAGPAAAAPEQVRGDEEEPFLLLTPILFLEQKLQRRHTDSHLEIFKQHFYSFEKRILVSLSLQNKSLEKHDPLF